MFKKKNLKKMVWGLALLAAAGLVCFGVLRACQRSWLLKGVEEDNPALIAKALKWGFPKDAVAQPGLPVLSKAVLLGHSKAARALVEQGVNLQARTTEKIPSSAKEDAPVIAVGTSPLGVAAFVCYLPGSQETARLLLENGLSPDDLVDGVSLAEVVAEGGETYPEQPNCWEVLRSFLEAGLDVNSTQGEELFMDVISGAPLWVRLISPHIPAELIESAVAVPDVNLNAQSKGGISGLMQAALLNRSDIAEVLLKAGADPNLAAPKGFTALEISKRQKYSQVEKVLRAHGAVK